MKDRLIELLSKCCAKNLNVTNLLEFEKLIFADYLIENGVIVPPCKVGDNLYYIPFGSTITKWEIRSIEIRQDDIVFHCGRIFFSKYDIGKTVFLTKEEAEQALKGEQSDGKL